jgi:hypothetical protein
VRIVFLGFEIIPDYKWYQRVVPAILLTGIQGLWKEKEVVYVMVVVLEVVVASFLSYVMKC